MRVNQMRTTDGDFHRGEWVQGEAWRNEPDIGLLRCVFQSPALRRYG